MNKPNQTKPNQLKPEHTRCTACGQVDGPVVHLPSRKDLHGKCRCGGDIEDIAYPPPLKGRRSSGWVVVMDQTGEKFPAIYDHADAVWRRCSYPGPVDGLPAYMWQVANDVVSWKVL